MPVQSRDLSNIHSLQEHLDEALRLDTGERDELRRLAEQLHDRPVLPVIGAGGSVDCGMRLAGDLAKDLHAEYKADPSFAPYPEGVDSLETDLGAVADAIALSRTQDDVVRALGLDDESLWPPAAKLVGHFCAYRVLARLTREDIFGEAVTFNYDCGFEAGLHDEGYLFSPTTLRGRRWNDHATVVSDAATNAELQRRGAFVLVKAHGCTARYRHAKAAGFPKRPEDAIILRWTQLLDWRSDLWARDVLSERARRHVVLLIGFSGQDPVIHIALTRVFEDVYGDAVSGEPRVIAVGWEPDTLTLRLLRRAGRGGHALAPGLVDHVSTRNVTTTAIALVLLAESLALRLESVLRRFGVVLGADLEGRLSALVVSAPVMLRWSFLLRRPVPWQDYAQRINLQQAAGRGYVPLMADPRATAQALRVRCDIRAALGLPALETTREAGIAAGFVVKPGHGVAYLPTGLPFRDLQRAARLGGELEQARRTLDHPRRLECVLVSDGKGGRRGLSLMTRAEVAVP